MLKDRIINQLVLNQQHPYLIAYLYLENDFHQGAYPNNFLIFDTVPHPWQQLNLQAPANEQLITNLLRSREVRPASDSENQHVTRWLQQKQQKFKKYLHNHTRILGEVLDYTFYNGYFLAYIFDLSGISKIYLFQESQEGFSVVQIDHLTPDLLLVELDFLRHILQHNQVRNTLPFQVAQYEFILVQWDEKHHQYFLIYLQTTHDQLQVLRLIPLLQKQQHLEYSTDKQAIFDPTVIQQAVKNFATFLQKRFNSASSS